MGFPSWTDARSQIREKLRANVTIAFTNGNIAATAIFLEISDSQVVVNFFGRENELISMMFASQACFHDYTLLGTSFCGAIGMSKVYGNYD